MNAISLTSLYDLLTLKLGKDIAGHLTAYIEDKVKYEIDHKSMSLPTKDDISRLDSKISSMAMDISKLDTKISDNKSELIKWMFVFWIAQAGTSFAFILLFVKK